MKREKLHYNRNLQMCEWLILNGIRYKEINKEEGYISFKTTKRYKDMCKLYQMSH